jgi:N-acetyl-anhydromuramyl-L-alanine amidase AmpD
MKLKSVLLAILCTALLAAGPSDSSAPTKLVITDRLLLAQSTARPTGQVVDHIVLHFSSLVTVHPDHPYDVDQQLDLYKTAKVSANYLIDREGKVYRMVPEDRTAWHAGKGMLPWDKAIKAMNQRSIGIEMLAIGSANDMKLFGMTKEKYDAFAKKHPEWIGFTDAQYATLNQLIKGIEARHPAILHDRFHIIGHEEWAGRARRTDPGELFDYMKIGLTKDRPSTQPSEN